MKQGSEWTRLSRLAATVPAALVCCMLPQAAARAASAMPAIDIAAACTHDDNPGMCEQIEASNRDQLRAVWPQLNEATRQACRQVGQQSHSYSTALGCAMRKLRTDDEAR
jgi:Spy/CpxP family protein refolding chaperone